jgi:hypothetical protein
VLPCPQRRTACSLAPPALLELDFQQSVYEHSVCVTVTCTVQSNAWKDSYYTVTLAFQLDAAIAQWQAGRAQAASAPVGSPPGTQIQGHRRLQPLDITPAHPKGTGPGSHEGALLQQQGHSYASAMLNTRAAAAEALGGPYAVLQPGGSGSLSGTLATLTALYSSVLGWLKAVSPTPTPDVSYSSGTQGSNAGAAAAWAPVGLGPTLAAPLPPVSLAACLASSGARLLYPYSAAFEVCRESTHAHCPDTCNESFNTMPAQVGWGCHCIMWV